jgi:pimeloyl-ACP methyl ester carboxylesterase
MARTTPQSRTSRRSSGSGRPGDDVRRPNLVNLATEWPRSAGEYAWMTAARPVLARAPRGDGHHVLVLPGLVADDRSTRALRRFLRTLGYQVHGWRLGPNVPAPDLPRRIQALIAQLHEKDPRPLSLVGWSLGGIQARSMTRLAPEGIRQVITLGSPFRTAPGYESNVTPMVRAVARQQGFRLAPAGTAGNDNPLPVPSTSIFTRTDGVVPWWACINTKGGPHETLEVVGASHVGLGHHPAVLWAVADRLAQPEGEWAPMTVPRRWKAVLRVNPGR